MLLLQWRLRAGDPSPLGPGWGPTKLPPRGMTRGWRSAGQRGAGQPAEIETPPR